MVDIFLAQRAKLRRIAAGMGLNASDVEDVLQDVSIKALKGSENLQTKEHSAPMADKSNHKPMPHRAPPGMLLPRIHEDKVVIYPVYHVKTD